MRLIQVSLPNKKLVSMNLVFSTLVMSVMHLLLLLCFLTLSTSTAANPQPLRGGVVQTFPGITVVDGKVQPEMAYGHAEIISCIETQLNVEITWQSLPTDRLLKLTQENQLDLIYPMGFTAVRDGYLQASIWLTKDDDYFVFKANVLTEDALQQEHAKSRTIGVKRGSPQLHFLQSNHYLHIHQVYEYPQLLPLLKMDRVELLAVPQPMAEQLQFEMQADTKEYNLQLYNYYTRDAGFYVSPDFAQANLKNLNEAVVSCRQHAKSATAIK